MDKLNGFNVLANVYDLMARLVFGKAITQSQTAFLPVLSDSSNVLVLGGGTGWIARELAAVSKAHIVYIDASDKMIEKAKKESAHLTHRITFIHGTEKDIPAMKFQGVITNFFLDLFSEEELERVVVGVTSVLARDGRWLATDFTSEKLWHRLFLRVMYGFFGITTGLTTRALPAWEEQLRVAHPMVLERKSYFGGFIRSVVVQSR
jgi:tRNA (cmo5U34)-methyltransferase